MNGMFYNCTLFVINKNRSIFALPKKKLNN